MPLGFLITENLLSIFHTLLVSTSFSLFSHCLDCIQQQSLLKITLQVHTIVLIGRICTFSECHLLHSKWSLWTFCSKKGRCRKKHKNKTKTVTCKLFYELLLKLKIIKHQLTLAENLLFQVSSLFCHESQYLKKNKLLLVLCMNYLFLFNQLSSTNHHPWQGLFRRDGGSCWRMFEPESQLECDAGINTQFSSS